MARKSPWKKYATEKRGPMHKSNREMRRRLIPQKPRDFPRLMRDIRWEIDPNILIPDIREFAERGHSQNHRRFLEIMLKRFPEKKSSPWPRYEDVRQAILDAIKKLEAKKN